MKYSGRPIYFSASSLHKPLLEPDKVPDLDIEDKADSSKNDFIKT